ncbi:MAG TPA: zinc-binding alcohol dehydrogenase family protein [Chitinophagaceae bacterium]|nr:zinc-binding alcohol dehydrogenase family protein [Chitinophagaceae bacterium]
MKALCVHSAYNLVIEERPLPVISSSNQVLIKVKAAGICGSDVHVYHGTSPVATYPRVIGHEIAGEIIETGEDVTGFAVGDRVVIDPVISCGKCYQCRIGRQNVCGKLQVRSVHVDGGYQEYIVMPQEGIYKIPQHLSWEEAVMIEPFTIAEQACSRAEITGDDVVFIMGAGPAGLSILKRAKMTGAICYISDILKTRLDIAKQYGADAVINARETDVFNEIITLTGNCGVTVVIDAVCNVRSLEQALSYVCPAGRVITFGFVKEPSAISQLSITAREIDIRGSRLHNNKFPVVIEHFEARRIEVKDMITHRFHFLDIHDALKLVDDPETEKGKVVLLF